MCETLTVNGFNPHTQQIHQFEAKYNTEVRRHFTAKKKKNKWRDGRDVLCDGRLANAEENEDISSLASIKFT